MIFFRALKTVVLPMLSLSLCAGPVLAQDPAPVTPLPAEAPARRTLSLQEVWRLGGEDDEDILLGVVGRAVMDDAGNTYLLDRQLSQVLVIGPDGDLAATLGREGEGPGEMRRPSDLFLMDDGRLGVSQGFPGKIVLLNGDGTPGGTLSIGESTEAGGFIFMGRAAQRGGHLVVVNGRGTFDREAGKNTTVQSLSLVDDQGRETTRFVEHTEVRDFNRQVFDEAKNFSEMDTWALGDGELFTVPVRDAYLIHRHDLTGRLTGVLRREFQPRRRDQKDKDDLTAGMRMIINGVEQEIEKHVLDTDPAIMRLDVAADGRLFVGTCFHQRKLLPEGVAAGYDVLSAAGEFLEELTLTIPRVNKDQDRLVFLDGVHWLLIRNFDSASESMNAGFRGGGAEEEDEEALAEVEPLEIVLYRVGE